MLNIRSVVDTNLHFMFMCLEKGGCKQVAKWDSRGHQGH